jgi:flagellar FliL protein
MKKSFKTMFAFAGVAILSGAVAAGTVWRVMQPPASGAASRVAAKKEAVKKPNRYVTLDKVIVMLRRGPHDSTTHYLAADLVLATTDEKERTAKEHLPMLRSVAVRALSGYEMPAAADMTVEQYAAQLNKTFDASYAQDRLEKPFSQVLISKLIIE